MPDLTATTQTGLTAIGPSYLTINQLSARTGFSVSTIRRLIRAGRLIAIQPGGARHRQIFSFDAIEQLTQPTTQNTPAETKPPCGPSPRWKKKFAN